MKWILNLIEERKKSIVNKWKLSTDINKSSNKERKWWYRSFQSFIDDSHTRKIMMMLNFFPLCSLSVCIEFNKTSDYPSILIPLCPSTTCQCTWSEHICHWIVSSDEEYGITISIFSLYLWFFVLVLFVSSVIDRHWFGCWITSASHFVVNRQTILYNYESNPRQIFFAIKTDNNTVCNNNRTNNKCWIKWWSFSSNYFISSR